MALYWHGTEVGAYQVLVRVDEWEREKGRKVILEKGRWIGASELVDQAQSS